MPLLKLLPADEGAKQRAKISGEKDGILV